MSARYGSALDQGRRSQPCKRLSAFWIKPSIGRLRLCGPRSRINCVPITLDKTRHPSLVCLSSMKRNSVRVRRIKRTWVSTITVTRQCRGCAEHKMNNNPKNREAVMRKKIVGLKRPFEHLDGIRHDNIRAIQAVAFSLLILATKAVGAPISDPGALSALQTTTVTFEDLAGVNEEQFGFGAGQPYINFGLTMGNQIVTVGANIGSMSGGIAVRSATVYTADNLNYQMLRFSSLQQGIGFYFRDNLATSVTIESCGQLGNPLESFTLPASTTTRYGGFLR